LTQTKYSQPHEYTVAQAN